MIISLTVLWGSMLAIRRALSMADSDGLQTIGVLGRPDESASGWAKCPMMSKMPELLPFEALEGCVDPRNSASSSSSDAVLLWVGLRVSKQMIPSKQSSRPSLFRALIACTLSAFVKICSPTGILSKPSEKVLS